MTLHPGHLAALTRSHLIGDHPSGLTKEQTTETMDPSPKIKGLRPYPRHWNLELVAAARLPLHPSLPRPIKRTFRRLLDLPLAPCAYREFSHAIKVICSASLHSSVSLRRRVNAKNVTFRISLWWPSHIINPVDKTKLSCNTPHRLCITVSLETYPLYWVEKL